MHHQHKVDAPSGTALAAGRGGGGGRRPRARGVRGLRARRRHRRAQARRDRLRDAARRRRGRRAHGDLRRRGRARSSSRTRPRRARTSRRARCAPRVMPRRARATAARPGRHARRARAAVTRDSDRARIERGETGWMLIGRARPSSPPGRCAQPGYAPRATVPMGQRDETVTCASVRPVRPARAGHRIERRPRLRHRAGTGRAGARIVLNGRDPARLDAAAAALRADGADVGTIAAFDVADAAAATAGHRRDRARRTAPLDILVNNAGVNQRQPLDAFSDAEWRAVMGAISTVRSTWRARCCRR